jgi:hypothetical protein
LYLLRKKELPEKRSLNALALIIPPLVVLPWILINMIWVDMGNEAKIIELLGQR